MAVVSVQLFGCTPSLPPKPLSTITFEEAKKTAMDLETEMRLALPQELVVSFDQNAGGILMNCSNGQSTWAGGTRVVLVGHPDTETLFDSVRQHFRTHKGFRLEDRRDFFGDPVFTILGRDSEIGGDHYSIGFIKDNSQVTIYSFSPCFTGDPDAD